MSPLGWLRSLVRTSLRDRVRRLDQAEVEELRVLAAEAVLAARDESAILPRLRRAEFKVHSQMGDDGIIQYLIGHLPNISPRFVEFGVGDYRESNTRYLQQRLNWSGLVLEADSDAVRAIRKDPHTWRHDLTVVEAVMTAENANQVIGDAGFSGDVGLLHIDIDGNDYWVWEALEVVRPSLAIIEYNALFGAQRAVSIPYDPAFRRHEAHHSNLYFGASIAALVSLGNRKGYVFLGCNSSGNNAYFVRSDQSGDLPTFSAAVGYESARFRESRDRTGRPSFKDKIDGRRTIASLPLVDVISGESLTVGDLPVDDFT